MTRHTDEVRADGRLAYPELAARDTVTDGHRILELKPLVHPSGMPVDPEPRWINEYDLPNAVIRLERLTDGTYEGWCTWTSVSGHGDGQVSVSTLNPSATLRLLSSAISNRHGAPVTVKLAGPELELTGHLETNRGKPIRPGAPIPRTFADALKTIGRRLIGVDLAGPDPDISDTDYVVFPNAGINLDVLFPDDPPAERPDLAGQADVAAELDHAMRRPGIAAGPGIAANPSPEWTPVGRRDVPLTLSEYMADPPTRHTRTHFTGTYVTPPPPELSPEELSSELGAIMDLMAPVRLLRDLCSGEDEHRLDVFDSFLRDLATRVTEIAAALHDAADR